MVSGSGNDTFNAGAGNDTMEGNGGSNSYNGSTGTDTVRYGNATGGVTANLTAGGALVNGFGGTDILTAIENLIGSNFDDLLTGSAVANVLIGSGGNDNLQGLAGNDTLDGGADNDTLNGGGGNDSIMGGDGVDTIAQLATDGNDFVDGGAGVDTFQLNGTAVAETFRIFTREAYLASVPSAVLNANTEIVITRNNVIMTQLDNVEEIRVNTLDVSANDGNGVPNGGTNSGDTIIVTGDFTQTSLDYSTITVNGSAANDTVDISGLTSDHRIVFNSGGGADHVVGTLRPQDVVDFADNGIPTSVRGGLIGSSPMPPVVLAIDDVSVLTAQDKLMMSHHWHFVGDGHWDLQ